MIFRRSVLTSIAFSIALTLGASPGSAEPIRGAGSTFAAPIIAKWSKSYQDAKTDGGDYTSPDWRVDYELVGSLSGIMRLRQPEMDFAATDAPLPGFEIEKQGYIQFPIVIGGIAIGANIPGVGDGQLRLTGQLLVDIHTGKIQNWSDPALRTVNPELKLPDLKITVIHRKDGSGSTATFTEYLSAVSPDWEKTYGTGTLINWPVGVSAEGTQAVLRAARATPGAITYLEFGQAARSGLPVARIGNRTGEFVRPDPGSFAAATTAGEWKAGDHFFRSLVDQPSPKAYPITAATYVIVPLDRGAARVRRVISLFDQAFETGASDASALALVPLPDELVKSIRTYWNKPRAGG